MTPITLSMESVYKKFRKGERYDSLRDLIPATVSKLFKPKHGGLTLEELEFWALKDVSFEVGQGEALAFLGHNGAGKSTLLKLLSGVMMPTSGRLVARGRISALIEVGAGFHPDLTGRENVLLNGVILGMSRAEVRRKFDEIVQFAGLEEFIDTPVKRYSSGMYARLGFSVAAHLEPDILIVDEVLSVGDQVFQRQSIEKMKEILRSGSTVIFVSHNLRAVTSLCSRAILLQRGTVTMDGPVSEVVRLYTDFATTRRTLLSDVDVRIETVSVSGQDGPRVDFDAGEVMFVDIVFRCVRPMDKVVCVCYLRTQDDTELVFMVASEALGLAPFKMEAGETRTCRFELKLHLPAGSYLVCAQIWESGRAERPIDALHEASILVREPVAILGMANLYPRLVPEATVTSSSV